jgi:ribosome-binding protein aMBF1 (putative translation factor)
MRAGDAEHVALVARHARPQLHETQRLRQHRRPFGAEGLFFQSRFPLATTTKTGEIFGAHLRALRTSRGLTQPQLAERCDSNVPFISNVERGVMLPGLAMLPPPRRGTRLQRVRAGGGVRWGTLEKAAVSS